jgi:integrase
MARKNDFVKTKYSNIYSLARSNGSTDFYTNFMLDGISYQKKNLSEMFGVTTAIQARDALHDLRAALRRGEDPFSEVDTFKVKDVVLQSIKERKPKNKLKDNSHYKRSLELFYFNYIHPVIGHLRLDKVTRAHTEKILESLGNNTKSFKLTLNVLMFKIFEDKFRSGKIKSNPFYQLDYGSHEPKASFDIRFNEPMETVARKLYHSAQTIQGTHKLLFIMSIMTVRRIGELHQLKFSHINRYSNGDWYVIATKDITKTGIEEKYPLPDEVVKLLPSHILEDAYKDEPLFSFCYSGMFKKFSVLVKKANLQLNKGHKFTPHDNRYLFISILASQGIDSDLADRCLSHNNKKDIKQIYLDVPFAKRKEVFEVWWNFLRVEIPIQSFYES